MLEKSVEEYLKTRVEALGGKCVKFETSSETGWPDRHIVLPGGIIYYVEFKRPKGGVFSKRQDYIIAELQRLGCKVRRIKSKEEVEYFIEEVKHEIQSTQLSKVFN